MVKTDPIRDILQSKKYRDLGIPEDTLRDLLEKEVSKGRSLKEADKNVRQKLHNIMAPYLGDPDYAEAEILLEDAFRSGSEQNIQQTCSNILSAHASTRERIPFLAEFYKTLFSVTGNPDSILDLACGLNPFSFPWMGLSHQVRYAAYDIHQPRIHSINRFFELMGMQPVSCVQDILVSPPKEEADVAFFFKEAHRFEQRQHGCNRMFWEALNVHYLLVSLPITSLDGRRNLAERQRRLVYDTISDHPWSVKEILIGTELVFCIEK